MTDCIPCGKIACKRPALENSHYCSQHSHRAEKEMKKECASPGCTTQALEKESFCAFHIALRKLEKRRSIGQPQIKAEEICPVENCLSPLATGQPVCMNHIGTQVAEQFYKDWPQEQKNRIDNFMNDVRKGDEYTGEELKKLTNPFGGIKNDEGKIRYALMPEDALHEIAKVFTEGAKKYSDRNWENGLDFDRPYSALKRHLKAWWQDCEERDPEWDISHLAHAGCCLLMLLSYQLRGAVGSKFDNRPRPPDMSPDIVDYD